MKQTRSMSLIEAITNVILGYGLAVITQVVVFPVFDLHATISQNLQIGALFSGMSLCRSFVLRRLFDRWQE